MATIKKAQIDEKYLWIGGGILAVIVVIFVFGRLSGKEDSKDPSDANPNIQPITVSTDSGNIDWDPSALVKEIHTAYKVNWTSGRCKALKTLMNLQDVQLRAVAEGYLKVYGETLRKVLEGAWVACWNVIGNDPHYIVINRLNTLQIP
ncbi:hypothetical protein [Aureispira anguillae]|uniref:Uncharacterized protein n=1 Tax=Aureispira anguillae TaxID=2864201 RepID=A0A915YGI4_9BACT|nr:hypothetical protein [Aureispira anguillae]BDS12737.1 hypothetical protein AsAng_0034620 [Aureispira anguillae]